LADLVGMLKKERDVLKKRVESLEHAIAGLGGDVAKNLKSAVKSGKKMSAAARKKISDAQKKRWAAVKKVAK
jgi:hypothetical protein